MIPIRTMMAKPMIPNFPKEDVSNLESRMEPLGSASAAIAGSDEGAVVDMGFAF
jgi:hypothetical protein